MVLINSQFLKVFNDDPQERIDKKVNRFRTIHHDANLIRLDSGDVSLPLSPGVTEAMARAIAEMSDEATFKGRGPMEGYPFLVDAIVKYNFQTYKVRIHPDEVFINHGTKEDLVGFGDILHRDNRIAVIDPVSQDYIAANVIGFSTAQHDPNLQNALIQTGLSKTEIKARYRTIPLRHTVYKRFGEQFHKVSGRMDSMRAQSLTPLGESMLFAAKVLAERHEERKVLFVITDGMPAVDLQPEGITFSHAREAIKRIEKAGVDVALLGIMTPSVADLHHRSVVINRVDDLPRAAMRQLQNILTK